MNIPRPYEAKIRFDHLYRDSVSKAQGQLSTNGLDHGKKILTDESECIRYLALYGGHHLHKLKAAYASTKFENIKDQDIEIIDWGCGQALATCVLIDYLIEKSISLNVISVTLVEPSIIALRSGQRLVMQMFQNNSSVNNLIRAVNKPIDELTYSDFRSERSCKKVHLFSNIIDVDRFDLTQLHRLMTGVFRGTNRIICISPYNYKNRLDVFSDLFLQSHIVTNESMNDAAAYGEIFYATNNQYEHRKINRYERQFTARAKTEE